MDNCVVDYERLHRFLFNEWLQPYSYLDSTQAKATDAIHQTLQPAARNNQNKSGDSAQGQGTRQSALCSAE